MGRQMDVESARRTIGLHVDRMRSAYGRVVFDEWAVLGLTNAGASVVLYDGPRQEQFGRNVAADSAPLRAVTAGKKLAEGDLEFAPAASGTQYDAFMKVGAASYLVLNHTGHTLDEIRRDPRWLAVQSVLFELSEKFRVDPLVVR